MKDATRSRQRLRLWLHLLQAQRSVGNRLRERVRVFNGVTLSQFETLLALDCHRDGLWMSELSAKLMVSNGNITRAVDQLEAGGLAERVPVDEDRRATRVRLTQDGVERFADMAAKHEAWVDEIMATFDDQELGTLIALLARLDEDQT